ncbi:FtsB family cell division protein [Aminipila luticellarii]|uniref:Septum formation initiator family protein n=1 Tax=Aminipila luticellarii TaxID=2507160 RepID=A0A410PSB1_9FIRM|nr:septum formation initiator family protein [Aminipila luticellarii]QAT41779.1 septum formation initiator family protein [Aminipila luticellarii]
MFKQKKKRSREFKNSDKIIDLEQARTERRARRKQAANKRQNKGRKAASEELSERKVNKRNRKRLIYLCVILGIMLVIGVSIFHVFSLQREYKNIAAQNKALKEQRQDLTEELGNVNNPEYIEQQARQQLKMVKPGEVLYVLPQKGVTGAAIVPKRHTDLMPAGEASD